MGEVMRLAAAGVAKPHIDSVFRFDDAASALRRLQEGKNVGKVLLAP
ncbi:MAG: zinc-binding dehydrogenase [Candidatus Eremiobacteraeota bacterium]|nr:zinc-binding dehydrogenase [Candidatus Eremiobacteraeota bacterium]